jgi:chromosome segregation ATPase
MKKPTMKPTKPTKLTPEVEKALRKWHDGWQDKHNECEALHIRVHDLEDSLQASANRNLKLRKQLADPIARLDENENALAQCRNRLKELTNMHAEMSVRLQQLEAVKAGLLNEISAGWTRTVPMASPNGINTEATPCE